MQRRGGRRLTGSGLFRTGMTAAAVLLVAAGTQVIPSVPQPPVTKVTVAASLPSVPFQARIEANLERVAAALTGATPEQAEAYTRILNEGRQLLHFDPEGNRGRGSWAELIGTIDRTTEIVGILVPGSAAFILDRNFDKYRQRADHLVEASEGRLAMVVWAAGTFPKGWLQGAMSHYRQSLGRSLAVFSHELRQEIARVQGPASRAQIVVAGHSFGGGVVGSAEQYGLDADVVMHIASSGMGDVRDPYDYPDPTRPRYVMTAPGDLIGLVQGLPTPPGLGHGPDPDEFRCTVVLPVGRLPDDPSAVEEDGRPLGERAGRPIEGIPSHSDVFIQHSDAWRQILGVFTGQAPAPAPCPPPADPAPVKARVLPLAVPRVVTDSQCRAGGGLRPGGRGGRRLRDHRRPTDQQVSG